MAARRTSRSLVVVLGLVLTASSLAHAATITVINQDGSGEGFNDPTPVAPMGGNPGTTLGAQRLNAFQHAATLWGAQIASAVEIRVQATFDPLDCNATSAVLGSAGATQAFVNFTGAPSLNLNAPSNFGQITSAAAARVMQMALRVSF